MALINCPECSKDVSNNAKACPHCGFEIQRYLNKQTFEELSLKYSKNIGGYKFNLMELYILKDENLEWASDKLSKTAKIAYKHAYDIMYSFCEKHVTTKTVNEYRQLRNYFYNKEEKQQVTINKYDNEKIITPLDIALGIILANILIYLFKVILVAFSLGSLFGIVN